MQRAYGSLCRKLVGAINDAKAQKLNDQGNDAASTENDVQDMVIQMEPQSKRLYLSLYFSLS